MTTSKEAKRAQMFEKIVAELKLAPDSTDAHVLDAIGDLLQRERDAVKRSQDDAAGAEVRRLRGLLAESFTVPAEQIELARAYVAGRNPDDVAVLDLDALRRELEAARTEVTRLSRIGLDALDAMLDAGHRGCLVDNIRKLTAERNEDRSELAKASSASAEEHVSALLAACEQNTPAAIQRFIAAGCERADVVAPGSDRSAPGGVRMVNLRMVDVLRVHELISAHTMLIIGKLAAERGLSPAVVEDFERFRQVAAARDLLVANGWVESEPGEWSPATSETWAINISRDCEPEVLRALAILAEEAQS